MARGDAYAGPDARTVQQMFAGIAHRYDFLNHFLSLSVDRYWRRKAVRKVGECLGSGRHLCLDLCSGTGDLALDLRRILGTEVVASDFCHPMLVRSLQKLRAKGFERSVCPVEADALDLPFQPDAFGAVTIAFGLRNLQDPVRGLEEMKRVLRNGGALVILEFSRPVLPVFRSVFSFYFRFILPWLGTLISGTTGPYQYLQASVQTFPGQEELAKWMRSVGFRDVGYRNLTGGIAALHWGSKAV